MHISPLMAARVKLPRILVFHLKRKWYRRRRPPDRVILEDYLLPRLARQCRRVLFVGVAGYTETYELIFHDNVYVTIDSDPSRAHFGARHHIISTLSHFAQSTNPESWDLVVLNGVIGHGINTPDQARSAFKDLTALLSGMPGLLLVGWNDHPNFTPFDIRPLYEDILERIPLHPGEETPIPESNNHRFLLLKKHPER